jgi:tetratricopeptide (TPR) repeat protein
MTGPTLADQRLDQAVLAFRARRPDEAERLAREVLNASRVNVRALQILGHALIQQDRAREAIGPLERAARRGEDPATDTLLGKALAAVGRREEALARLQRAAAARPPFAQAFLELGEHLAGAGRLEEAARVFEQGLALTPEAAVLRLGLGRVHLRGNDRAGARRLFEQVLADAPERHDALAALARVLTLEGAYADAAELCRRALRQRPDDALAWINLGKCLLELGEREAGEAALRSGAQAGPQFSGLAITALAAASHGRMFLRPSAATRFLNAS